MSNLEVGQAIHLGEIPLPAGVEVLGEKGIPVIAVAAPITEEEEAAALEAGAGPLAEPEVLTEKKDDEGSAGEGKPAPSGKPEKAEKSPATEKPEKPGKK